MDLFFPLDDQNRQEFKDSALQLGFEELAAECTAHLHMLEPHDKLAVLVLAWTKIGDYLTQNQYSPCVGTAVNWVGRYTINLWFGRDWISCSNEYKTSLIEHMMKVYPAAYISMHPFSWPYMFSIYQDPWMVTYLNTNFQRYNRIAPPHAAYQSHDELEPRDIEFLQQEGIALVILRLVNMFDFGMIQLVKHICLRVIWLCDDQTASRSIRATPNSSHYLDCARHIYLIAVCQSSGTKNLNFLFEYIQRSMQCNIAEPRGTFQEAASMIANGLKESKTTLTEFLYAFLLQCPETHSTNIFGCAIVKYSTFVTEYLLRKVHSLSSKQLLLSHDNSYGRLVQIFIKQRESTEELMQTTEALSEKLFSNVHNLDCLKLAYEQVKTRTRSEWYTTKLTILIAIINEELNKLEELKYTEDQATDALIANEKQLATFYCELSKLLVKVPYLEQESWLTTFSLYPCKEYLECVTKCGTRNLRAIKKQATKLDVSIDLKPKRPAKIIKKEGIAIVKEETPTDRPDISQETSTSTACLVTPYQAAITESNRQNDKKPSVTVAEPCTSAAFLASLAKEEKSDETTPVPAEIKSEILPKSTPKKRGPRPKHNINNSAKFDNPKAAKNLIKAKRGRPYGNLNPKLLDRKQAKEEKALKSLIVKTITVKPDDKDKDSAEVLFSAAAGASDGLSKQTERSIKYPSFALINSVTDTEDLIKFTDYDNEVVQYHELNRVLTNLGLKNTVYDDILALIVSPRYKRLTWAICWKILRKRCRELLTKEPKKRQLVQQSMADANDRLTHLDIDYDKYKDKPQIDYGTIEGGYECFETDSGEDSKAVAVGPNATKVKGSAKRSGVRGRRPKLPTDIFAEITRTKLSSPIFLSKPLYICCRGDSKSPRLALSICPMSAGSPIVPPQRSPPILLVSSDNSPPRLHPEQRTLLEILTGNAAPMNSHGISLPSVDPATLTPPQRRASLSMSSGRIESTIGSVSSTPVVLEGNQETPNSAMPMTEFSENAPTMQPSTTTSILEQQLSKPKVQPSTSRQYLESVDDQPKDLTVDKSAKPTALPCDTEPTKEFASVSPSGQQAEQQLCTDEIENDDSLVLDETLLLELIPSTSSNTIQLRQELGITSSMLNSIYPPVTWHETPDGKKVIDCRNQDPRVILCLVEAAIANSSKPISASFSRFNKLLAKWKQMWAIEQSSSSQSVPSTVSPSEGNNKATIIDDVMLSKDNEYTISATHMDIISPTAFSKIKKPKQQRGPRKEPASDDSKDAKRPKVVKSRKRPADGVISTSAQPTKVVVQARKPRKPATTKRIDPCDAEVVTVEAILDELRQQKLSKENVSLQAQAATTTTSSDVKPAISVSDNSASANVDAIGGTSVVSESINANPVEPLEPTQNIDNSSLLAVTGDISSLETAATSKGNLSRDFISAIGPFVEVLENTSTPKMPTDELFTESKSEIGSAIVAAAIGNADALEVVISPAIEVLVETTTSTISEVPNYVESSEPKSQIDNETVLPVAVSVNTFEVPSSDAIPTESKAELSADAPESDMPIQKPPSDAPSNIESLEPATDHGGGSTTEVMQTPIECTTESELELNSPTVSAADATPTLKDCIDALKEEQVQAATEEGTSPTDPTLSVATPGELFDIDSLAGEQAVDEQSVSTSEADAFTSDSPHAVKSQKVPTLVTTSELALEIQAAPVGELPTVPSDNLAADTKSTTTPAVHSASSMDDILHDQGKVFNNNLLHPKLKTYGSNRGSLKFEKHSITSNSTVAKVSDITIATTIACTIGSSTSTRSTTVTKPAASSTSTTNTSSTANIDRCTGAATPSQLIMPYPFDVVTSLLFQHANASPLPPKDSTMFAALPPMSIQEQSKLVMESLACKLKKQFVNQYNEFLKMNLDSLDEDIAVILFGRLLLDGDEKTIASFPDKKIVLDLDISAPKMTSTNVETELSIDMGEPEHSAHIVKLTMSGKTAPNVELSTLLDEFARSRLRAGSPTIYSPALSLKEVKSGKNRYSNWLQNIGKDNFKWVLSTERKPKEAFMPSTASTNIEHEVLRMVADNAATDATATTTASTVVCNKYKSSNLGIGAHSSSLPRIEDPGVDDMFSDVHEIDQQEVANDNNSNEAEGFKDKEQHFIEFKARKANILEEENVAATEEMLASEEKKAVDTANKDMKTSTDPGSKEATANDDMIPCTHPTSEEKQAVDTANKDMKTSIDPASEKATVNDEMISCTNLTYDEKKPFDTANKNIKTSTDPATEKATKNEEIMPCTDSASEEKKAVDTTNYETKMCTDLASDEATENKEMVTCTASASEEATVNKEMVVCTASASEEATAKEEMKTCTDAASEETTAKEEMKTCTYSASEEITVIKDRMTCTASASEEATTNKDMKTCTYSASDEKQVESRQKGIFQDSDLKSSGSRVSLNISTIRDDIEPKEPEDQNYLGKKVLTEKLSQQQTVMAGLNENSLKNETTTAENTQLDDEEEVSLNEKSEIICTATQKVVTWSDAKDDISLLQEMTNENTPAHKYIDDNKDQNSERLKSDETDTICEKVEHGTQPEEQQPNSDEEKSRQPSIAFSSDRDSPSTSFAAAAKRTSRKMSTRKSAPVRRSSTRNVEKKMRQKVKLREEDYYECTMQSTANDSDDDAGSDYLPRRARARVVRPMKLRCIRRSYIAELATESSSCSSTAPARRNKKVFATKSTSKKQVTSRSSIKKTSLVSTPRLTASEKAAYEYYKCKELRVSIPTISVKDADIWCRKSRVLLFRLPMEEENLPCDDDIDLAIDFECPVEMEVDADDECGPDEDPLLVNEPGEQNILPDDALKSKLRLIIPFPLPAPASDSSDESEEDEEDDEEDITVNAPKTSSSESTDDDDDDDFPTPSRALSSYRAAWCRNRNSASARESAYDNAADENCVTSTTDDTELVPDEGVDDNNNSKSVTSKLTDIPSRAIDILDELVASFPLERVTVFPLVDRVKIPIRDFDATLSVALGVAAGVASPQIHTGIDNREYFYSNTSSTYNVTSTVRIFNSFRYVDLNNEAMDSVNNNERMRTSGTNNANTTGAVNVSSSNIVTSSARSSETASSANATSADGTGNVQNAAGIDTSNVGASSSETGNVTAANTSDPGTSAAGTSNASTSNLETNTSNTGASIVQNAADTVSSSLFKLDDLATTTAKVVLDGDVSATGADSIRDLDNEAECTSDEQIPAVDALNTTGAITGANYIDGASEGIVSTSTQPNVEYDNADFITYAESIWLDSYINEAHNMYVANQPIMNCDNEVECMPDGNSHITNSEANPLASTSTAAASNPIAAASNMVAVDNQSSASCSNTENTADNNDTNVSNQDQAGNRTAGSSIVASTSTENKNVQETAHVDTSSHDDASVSHNISQDMINLGDSFSQYDVEWMPYENVAIALHAIAVKDTTDVAKSTSTDADNTDSDGDEEKDSKRDPIDVTAAMDTEYVKSDDEESGTSSEDGEEEEVTGVKNVETGEENSDEAEDSSRSHSPACSDLGGGSVTTAKKEESEGEHSEETQGTSRSSSPDGSAVGGTTASRKDNSKESQESSRSQSPACSEEGESTAKKEESEGENSEESKDRSRSSSPAGPAVGGTTASKEDNNGDNSKESQDSSRSQSPACSEEVENTAKKEESEGENSEESQDTSRSSSPTGSGDNSKESQDTNRSPSPAGTNVSVTAATKEYSEGENSEECQDSDSSRSRSPAGTEDGENTAKKEKSEGEDSEESQDTSPSPACVADEAINGKNIASRDTDTESVDNSQCSEEASIESHTRTGNSDEESSGTSQSESEAEAFNDEKKATKDAVTDKAVKNAEYKIIRNSPDSNFARNIVEAFPSTSVGVGNRTSIDDAPQGRVIKDNNETMRRACPFVGEDDPILKRIRNEIDNAPHSNVARNMVEAFPSTTASASNRTNIDEAPRVRVTEDNNHTMRRTFPFVGGDEAILRRIRNEVDIFRNAARKFTEASTAACARHRTNIDESRRVTVTEDNNHTARRTFPFVGEDNSILKRIKIEIANAPLSNVPRQFTEALPSTRTNIDETRRVTVTEDNNQTVRRTFPFVGEDNPILRRMRNEMDNAPTGNVGEAYPSTSFSARNRTNIDEAPRDSVVGNNNNTLRGQGHPFPDDHPSLVDHDYVVIDGVQFIKRRNNWNMRPGDDFSRSSSPHHQNPQQTHYENTSNPNTGRGIRFTRNDEERDYIYGMFQPHIDSLNAPDMFTYGEELNAHYISPNELDPGQQQMGDVFRLPPQQIVPNRSQQQQMQGQQHLMPNVSYLPEQQPMRMVLNLPAQKPQISRYSRAQQMVSAPQMTSAPQMISAPHMISAPQMASPPPQMVSSPEMVSVPQMYPSSHQRPLVPNMAQQQMMQQQIFATTHQQPRYSTEQRMSLYSSELPLQPPSQPSSQPPSHMMSSLNTMQTFSGTRPSNMVPYSSHQRMAEFSGQHQMAGRFQSLPSPQYPSAPVTGSYSDNEGFYFNDSNRRVSPAPRIQDMIPVFDGYYTRSNENNADDSRQPMRRPQAIRPPVEIPTNSMQRAFLEHMHQKLSSSAAASSNQQHRNMTSERPQLRPVHVLSPDFVDEWNQRLGDMTRNYGPPPSDGNSDDHPYASRGPMLDPDWSPF